MSLTTKEKQQLKAKAHKLRPVVMLGINGLTATVNNEIDRALNDHELIKIRISQEDRELRRALFSEVSKLHGALLIQQIGSIGVLYRKNNS